MENANNNPKQILEMMKIFEQIHVSLDAFKSRTEITKNRISELQYHL